jgi:hypothetical protein
VRIGVSIQKSGQFRGTDQEFANEYHFELETAVTAPSESIVDEITAKEKTFHSTDVKFVRAKVWTAGGTKAENQMIFQKNLAGTGTQLADAVTDRERAILIRFKAGFDSRGLPVYLRKWYHTFAPKFAGSDFGGAGVLANTQQLSSTVRAAIATAADPLQKVGANLWELCSSKGRNVTNLANAECHPYFEHRQLGDSWRN